MKLEDIIIILKICETKSFTKTGEALQYNQSAVSKRVKKVEEELGLTLFERIAKSDVKETLEMKQIKNHLLEIQSSYDALLKKIAVEEKKISLLSATGYEKASLFNIIDQLEQKGYLVKIGIENTQQIIESIINNETDTGIIGYPVTEPGVYCEKIYEQQIVLAGLEKYQIKALDELKALPFISQQKGSGLREFVIEQLKAKDIDYSDLTIIMEAGYEEFVFLACKRGMGVTFMPETEVKLPLKVLNHDKDFKRNFWIITKNESKLSLIKSIIT